MKKLLFFILVAVAFSACSDDGEELNYSSNDEVIGNNYSSYRTQEEAISTATNLAAQMFDSQSRSARMVDPNSVICVKGGSRSAADTLLYIVNYEGNQGYAIIAGPKNVLPVYAIVDSGQ